MLSALCTRDNQDEVESRSHSICMYIFTFPFIWFSCHQPRMRKVIKNHFLYLYGFPYTIERGSKCNIRWKYVSSFYSPSRPFNLWQCFENVFYFSTIYSCCPYAMYSVSGIASLCESQFARWNDLRSACMLTAQPKWKENEWKNYNKHITQWKIYIYFKEQNNK